MILGVENEVELDAWEWVLHDLGIVCECFVEPDMDGQKTALAIHPGTNGRLFRSLRLL